MFIDILNINLNDNKYEIPADNKNSVNKNAHNEPLLTDIHYSLSIVCHGDSLSKMLKNQLNQGIINTISTVKKGILIIPSENTNYPNLCKLYKSMFDYLINIQKILNIDKIMILPDDTNNIIKNFCNNLNENSLEKNLEKNMEKNMEKNFNNLKLNNDSVENTEEKIAAENITTENTTEKNTEKITENIITVITDIIDNLKKLNNENINGRLVYNKIAAKLVETEQNIGILICWVPINENNI